MYDSPLSPSLSPPRLTVNMLTLADTSRPPSLHTTIPGLPLSRPEYGAITAPATAPTASAPSHGAIAGPPPINPPGP